MRDLLLKEQNNLCALCQQEITNDAVLDHSHATGFVRGVLHRGCNSLEGKITNNLKRNNITLQQLYNIFLNFQGYTQSKTDLIHPTYFTPEERKERTKARAKKLRQRKKNV